jgi:hypothetical protein
MDSETMLATGGISAAVYIVCYGFYLLAKRIKHSRCFGAFSLDDDSTPPGQTPLLR